MDVIPANYMPGDPILIDKIVYELKSQGIFDNFRRECISDVDTKPAYQNLRQRVEGNVANFLRTQNWSPDMNKNQLRELLRKTIHESGFLETGVERIVDQVVNPKMTSVFLPKVSEVVYKYLGIERPNKSKIDFNETVDNLMPKDLEAVSPESGPFDKSGQSVDDSKMEEDESPPFEPIDDPVIHEENSVDSNVSGFSGLMSHDSNHSDGTRPLQIDMDTQMSKNSSDSVSMQIEEGKMEIYEDSKSLEIGPSYSKKDEEKKEEDKKDDKNRHKSDSKRTESRSDRRDDRKSDKKHSTSSRDRKDSGRQDSRSRNDKDRHHSSSSRHSSSSHYKSSSSSRKDSTSSSRDKKDYKSDSKDRSRDKLKETKSHDSKKSHSSHSKNDHRKSSSGSTRNEKKDPKKRNNKDDHFSSKHKPERRSTDRDSNDGSGLKSSSSSYSESNSSSQNSTSQNNKPQDSSNSNSNDSGNSEAVETRNPVILSSSQLQNSGEFRLGHDKRIILPKIASNIHEARRLMKIRKQLRKIEKQSSLTLVAMNKNLENEPKKEEKVVEEELLKPRIMVSMATWDALEAKLNETMNFDTCYDPDLAERTDNLKELRLNNEADKIEKIDIIPSNNPEIKDEDFRYFIENTEDERIGKMMHEEIARLEAEIRDMKINFELSMLNNIPTIECKDVDKENKEIGKKRKHEGCEHFKKIKNNNNVIAGHIENFSLPLSPAESDKSTDKKEFETPLSNNKKTKFNNNQRYSSDDLYKPRTTIKRSTSRRGANVD